MQCTSSQKWVHRKCSGIKGSMYKVMKTFICRGCVNPVTGTECTSVDNVGNANLELADKFCYLGDMLSVVGDADAAVETRIRIYSKTGCDGMGVCLPRWLSGSNH